MFTIFAVILFYLKNESTMRSGFINILSKFNEKTINEINTLSGILDYSQYLGSDQFKQNIEKNFKFIGLVSIRQMRTSATKCRMYDINMNETCYEETYNDKTKFYDPILFKLANGTQDYLYYESNFHTKIKSVAEGLYSSYDGSGYIFTFDHTDTPSLPLQRRRFEALSPTYFKENTKAVIINYNLHYPVLNVNLTAQVVAWRLSSCSRYRL